MLPLAGSRAQYEPRQRFFALQQASSNSGARSRPVCRTGQSPWLHRAAILMIESEVGTTSCPNASPKPCALRASLAGRMPWGIASSRSCSPCPDAVMARYLIQDHRFLDSFLTLLGAALASADTFEARLRFGRFIGMVSGQENTYFLRAFEALGVTEVRRTADPDTQPTA